MVTVQTSSTPDICCLFCI